MGYDAAFYRNIDDGRLIEIALEEGRIILTRDTHIMKRRIVVSGKVKAILINYDQLKEQLGQVVMALNLSTRVAAFSRCIECNQPLVPRDKEEIRDMVPPYVFQTQTNYMQCPACCRIYWRGTHWDRMNKKLQELKQSLD